MQRHYLENRSRVHGSATKVVADIMRHWHARHQLGPAIVVSDDPTTTLAQAQRHWRKLSRDLQHRRMSANDANEILRLTYLITRMQNVTLVAQPPHEQPEADVFFVRPGQLHQVSHSCQSVYLTMTVAQTWLDRIIRELPNHALVVDYAGQLETGNFGLRAHAELELSVRTAWQSVKSYFDEAGLNIEPMLSGDLGALEDTLDALLNDEQEFLHVATKFLRTLSLARPFQLLSKSECNRFDTFTQLVFQLQSLSSSTIPVELLDLYTDETFFLRDRRFTPAESLADQIARHESAGHWNIARALLSRRRAAHPMRPMRSLLPVA